MIFKKELKIAKMNLPNFKMLLMLLRVETLQNLLMILQILINKSIKTDHKFLKLTLKLHLLKGLLLISKQSLLKPMRIWLSWEIKKLKLTIIFEEHIKMEMMLTIELPLPNKTLMQLLRDSKMNPRSFQMLLLIFKEQELKKL